MPDLIPEAIENLRRSAAMLAPKMPSGLSAGQAIRILEQLRDVTEHRDHLLAELVELGYAWRDACTVALVENCRGGQPCPRFSSPTTCTTRTPTTKT